MNDCRAAVITSHNQPLEILRVPIPDPLEPGALLVKISASTLCGTDVHRWHGPLPGGDTLPIITGHEPCGIAQKNFSLRGNDQRELYPGPGKRRDAGDGELSSSKSGHQVSIAKHGPSIETTDQRT